MEKLPQRHLSHIKEDKSRRFFKNTIPEEWTTQDINPDYGIDLIVETFGRNGYAKGSTFVVQLKSTGSNFEGKDVTVTMDAKNLNYLRNRVEPALIVLYVIPENEAYAMWVRELDIDWDSPQNTHTIRIPKQREYKLSNMNWSIVDNFIDHLRKGKIEAGKLTMFIRNEIEDD